MLKLSEFEKELLRFLFSEYEDQMYAPLLGRKVFYCSVGNLCNRFWVSDGLLKFELVDELFGSHSEADTRVMMHAKHADQEFGGNIVIRANDTDILIIAATNMRHLVRSSLWMDIGHPVKEYFVNTKRMWLISRLYKTATNQYPAEEYTPIDYSWELSSDGEFCDIHWFDGEQIPKEMEEIEAENDEDDNEDTDNETEDDSSSGSDEQSDSEDEEKE